MKVLASAPDGRSQVVEQDDGSVVSIGWAEAPSGERVVTRSVVKPAPVQVEAKVQARMAGGGAIEVVVPHGESALARAMRYEAARLEAMKNYGQPSPPWERKPVERSPEQVAADARQRVLALSLEAEDEQRWKALSHADRRPGLAAELAAAKDLAERLARGEAVASPPPAADPDKRGTFADPETKKYVSDQALEAKATADQMWEAVQRGDYRGPVTTASIGWIKDLLK